MSMIKKSLRENVLEINFRNDESMIRDLEPRQYWRLLSGTLSCKLTTNMI